MTEVVHIAPIRVLVVAGDASQRAELTRAADRLGHRAIAAVAAVEDVAEVMVRERPDVALVDLGADPDPGLTLLRRVAESRECGVVAVFPTHDEELVLRAAACGAHAVAHQGEDRLAGALAIAAARHADYRGLQGAFARRSVTERAKGMLMERHGVDERRAFTMLRSQARSRGRRLEEIAEAVLDSHSLLSVPAPSEAMPRR
jgi:response regulator NasT